MRAKEFITESLSRIVYHYTGLHAAAKILASGKFQLSSNLGSIEQKLSLKGYPYFLSTTRTKTGGYHNYVGSSAVLFELDGNYYNQTYPSRPIDYWENRPHDKAYGRKHEAEDRLFSKEPSISIDGVKSVHVLVRPDADPAIKAVGRTVLIEAKKRGIPTIYYDNEAAWRSLDPKKSVSISGLKGQQPSRRSYSRHRGYLLPWMEILQAKDKNHLSKDAKKLIYNIGYDYYKQSMIDGLNNEMSNARKPESGADREHAVKIIKYMRDNKLNTIPELVDNLQKKWSDKSLNEDRKLGPSLVDQGYEFKKVRIYRAMLASSGKFNSMDYVTRSLKFAKEHADHVQAVEDEPAHVIEAIVNASDVYDAYNPGEYFYNGPEITGKVIYTPQLDESWGKTLATAALAGGLALGGQNLLKKPDIDTIMQAPEVSKPKQILPISKPAIPVVIAKLSDSLRLPAAQELIRQAEAAGIEGLELAQFLAQCAHETHNFRSLKEWGKPADFRKYDIKYNPQKAKILGNTKPGDGLKYIGRGFIQLTGKYNYQKAQKELGIPIADKPELLEDPKIAAQVAVWYWQHRVSPKVDDFSNTHEVTKPINSRLNGLEDRKSKFKAIASLIGLDT